MARMIRISASAGSNDSLRDKAKLHPALGVLRALADIESLPLELDDVPLLQTRNLCRREGRHAILRLGVDDLLQAVVLLELLLGDEVVVLDQGDWHQRVLVGGLSEPGDLLRGLLEVALEVESDRRRLDGAVGTNVLGGDEGVAPVHESHFLVIAEGLCVVLLDKEGRREDEVLVADLRVLLVQRLRLSNDGVGVAALDLHGDDLVLGNSPVTGRNGVNDTLVDGPDTVPLELHVGLRSALANDVVLQTLDSHTARANTADSGETGVVPALRDALLDKVLQLTLGKHGVDKVDTAEVEDFDLGEAKTLEEPLVLLLACCVLIGTESVGDALNVVDDGAGKVVSGVGLVLGAEGQ